jgi:periplasmic protein TonB
MKTILLGCICLSVSATLSFGQQTADSTTISASQLLVTTLADDYVATNNEPFFPGGITALQDYLKQQALYPRQAWMAQIEGTVRVKFRVQPTGYLTDLQVVESAGLLLNQAAIKAVVNMPRWFPAHRHGEAVARTVIMPITFQIP